MAWAFEQYLNRDMPDAPVGDWVKMWDDWSDPFKQDCFVGKIDSSLLQRARAGYYGHMTHVDHQINRFIEGLHDYGLSDNTYFCFVSDHGEMMGDHNMFRKAFPYEGSTRIPLVLAGPENGPVKVNASYNQVVELRDVVLTLLNCAGLPIPETVEGRSLFPIITGEKPLWREYLHGEHTFSDRSSHWITNGREKFIWFSGTGEEQLFDLEKDPQELYDLAGSPDSAGRVKFWRRILIQELAGREEGFTDGAKLIPGKPVKACLSHIQEQI